MWFKKKKIIHDEIDLYCPRDNKKMKKRQIGDVIIDECPKCHGYWFDDNEVDKLIAHANEIGLQEEIEKKIKAQDKKKAPKKTSKKKTKKKVVK